MHDLDQEQAADLVGEMERLEAGVQQAVSLVQRLREEKRRLEEECARLREERVRTAERLTQLIHKVDALRGDA